LFCFLFEYQKIRYSRLWNEALDLTTITFHPLQSLVPMRVLERAFERTLIRATVLVGVDINNAAKNVHLSSTLQFVPGLGPRKAKALLAAIRNSGGSVATRMVDLRKFLAGNVDSSATATVWNNAVAYLRITANHFHSNPERRAPLDHTRIHPNDYRFAVKVAQDALDRAEDVQGTEDLDELEAKRVEVLREVMGEADGSPNEHHDDIVRVDVTGMAEAWRENYGENKARVMQALKEEMLAPFAEKRSEFRELDNTDAFWICVESDPAEFMEGRLFHCLVREVRHKMVKVEVMEEELICVIMLANLSDKEPASCEGMVTEGGMMPARLIGVDFERWQLRLTSRGSELQNVARYESARQLEQAVPHLRWQLAENERVSARVEKERRQLERAIRQARQGQATMRVVDHPSFRNFSLEETVAALRDAPVGEAIFRPSSKGSDFLTLSYKGVGDTVVHVLVAEKDKPHAQALGRKLSVQGVAEDFEDLDQVLAQYVNPMTERMAELAEHHRFVLGKESEVEQHLAQDRAAHPNDIVYRIGLDEKNPGYFKIFFMPGQNIHHAAISLRPTCFRLRKRNFGTFKELMMWFKRHYSDDDATLASKSSSAKKAAPGNQRRK
jgi:transcription elongation factor SPT6